MALHWFDSSGGCSLKHTQMEKYYSISGYWKDNDMTFENYIATSSQDSFNISYPHDRIFIFGFDPTSFSDDGLDYIITSCREIKHGKKMAFNVTYLTSDDEVVDETQVDENDPELIWELFADFGHVRNDGMYYELEEVEVDE